METETASLKAPPPLPFLGPRSHSSRVSLSLWDPKWVSISRASSLPPVSQARTGPTPARRSPCALLPTLPHQGPAPHLSTVALLSSTCLAFSTYREAQVYSLINVSTHTASSHSRHTHTLLSPAVAYVLPSSPLLTYRHHNLTGSGLGRSS